MSEQLFEVSGISLDDAVHLLYGNGVPGNSEETDTAPVGSSYNNTDDGSKWQKVALIGGTAGWLELAGKDAAIVVEHIASTGVILDQVPTQKVAEFAWMITAVNEADPTNKYSCLIHMSHNGMATQDATAVTFDQSSILRMGSKIAGLQITGTLTGTGATQFMNLHVASATMVTFFAYRMVKNIAGSSTVILGGANLSNHVADGTVHLMPWQNTLLDGLNQALTSTQVNSLLNVTGNIQLQLASKASATDVATSLAGKSDLAYVNQSLSGKQDSLGFTPENSFNKSRAGGYAALGADSKVPLTQLPDYLVGLQSVAVGGGILVPASSVVGLANVAISGSYADLSNTPTNVTSLVNDAEYQNAAQVTTAINNAAITTTANFTAWTGTPYDLGFAVSGIPAPLEIVYRFLVVRDFTTPANFYGSMAKADNQATANTVLSIRKNGNQVGTLTFLASSSTGVFSTQASISFAVGDRLSVVAPSTPDATLSDIDITIKSSLT